MSLKGNDDLENMHTYGRGVVRGGGGDYILFYNDTNAQEKGKN